MSCLHQTYRTRYGFFTPVFRKFLQVSVISVSTCGVLLQGGQTKTTSAGATVQTTNSVIKTAATASTGETGLAGKQNAPLEAMLASVDKQKMSVKAQAGKGSATDTDSFFTAPWATPATIPVPVVVPSCSAMAESDLKPFIEESAKMQDLKPELIRAVIRRESASYACAVSEKGAIGLMQLMPDVAQQFGADPLDPQQNVQAGSRYLKQLMTRYKGDLKLALAAYNAGPQAVDAQNKVPDIPETTSYVDAILKDLKENAPSAP